MAGLDLPITLDEKAALRVLEATGRYRILRRVDLDECLSPRTERPTRKAVFVDIESTGLDVTKSELIEIAVVQFEYELDGAIVAAELPRVYLNEPKQPISQTITQLTGISDDMVRGHRLDPDEIAKLIEEADVVIAHNAAFDRPIAERYCGAFKRKPWICSMEDITWADEGATSRKLSDLLARFNLFFDAHRAADDCEAGVALLTHIAPKSGRRLFQIALENGRQASWRIFVMGTAYSSKQAFADRGYRWNTNLDFGPKAWWVEVRDKDLLEESEFLTRQLHGGGVQLDVFRVSAYERFTARYIERGSALPNLAI